jgi:hypothetical protein
MLAAAIHDKFFSLTPPPSYAALLRQVRTNTLSTPCVSSCCTPYLSSTYLLAPNSPTMPFLCISVY